MSEYRCPHCGFDNLELSWAFDDSMVQECAACEARFSAKELKGCPKCGGRSLEILLGSGDHVFGRCRGCGAAFDLKELGNCPRCGSPDTRTVMKVDDVVVKCLRCGRSGSREEMMRETPAPPPKSPGSSCFIATAACGSDQAGDVVRLRQFRDGVLRRTGIGRAAIALYELASPPFARVIGRSAAFRWLARTLIVRPARHVADRISISNRTGTG